MTPRVTSPGLIKKCKQWVMFHFGQVFLSYEIVIFVIVQTNEKTSELRGKQCEYVKKKSTLIY
jgi:hypothetical protein